jgi:hypothetical protein
MGKVKPGNWKAPLQCRGAQCILNFYYVYCFKAFGSFFNFKTY